MKTVELPLVEDTEEFGRKLGEVVRAGDDQWDDRHRLVAVFFALAETGHPHFAEHTVPAPAEQEARDRGHHHGEIVDVHFTSTHSHCPVSSVESGCASLTTLTMPTTALSAPER